MSLSCPSYLRAPSAPSELQIRRVVRVMRQRKVFHGYLKVDAFTTSPFYDYMLQAVSTFSGVMYCMAYCPDILLSFLDLVHVILQDREMRSCLFEPMLASQRTNVHFRDNSTLLFRDCASDERAPPSRTLPVEDDSASSSPALPSGLAAHARTISGEEMVDVKVNEVPLHTVGETDMSTTAESVSPLTTAFTVTLEPFRRPWSNLLMTTHHQASSSGHNVLPIGRSCYACINSDLTRAASLMEVAVRLMNPIMIARFHSIFPLTYSDEENEFLERVRAKIAQIRADTHYSSLAVQMMLPATVQSFGRGQNKEACMIRPILADIRNWTEHRIVPESRYVFTYTFDTLMVAHLDEYDVWFDWFTLLVELGYPFLSSAHEWIRANGAFLKQEAPTLYERLCSIAWTKSARSDDAAVTAAATAATSGASSVSESHYYETSGYFSPFAASTPPTTPTTPLHDPLV